MVVKNSFGIIWLESKGFSLTFELGMCPAFVPLDSES